jgi:hypothetical protein
VGKALDLFAQLVLQVIQHFTIPMISRIGPAVAQM